MPIYRGDVYETANMMNTLQASSDIPLLIAANLEKGLGNQMDGATLFPPIMSIGATGSEELSYQMGKITALEARAAGIHMAYFPVVDVTVLDQVLASETHLRWADSVLEQSMTLVKDTSRILPLSPEKKIAVFSLSSDPGDYYAGKPFIQEIKKRDPKAIEFYAEASTGNEFLGRALQKTAEVDVFQ